MTDMMFGYSPIIGNGGVNGKFNWTSSNNSLDTLGLINSPNLLMYNISANNQENFPDGYVITNTTVSNAFSGGILHPNGKIYFIPASETFVQEFNPLTNEIINFGSLGATTNKWFSATIAPNGLIYCLPYTSINMLVINPYNRTTSLLGTSAGGTFANFYRGAVLGRNNKIYAIPSNNTASDSFEFNPYTNETIFFGNVGSIQYYGGVLAPNGKIYCIPYSTNNCGIIDTDNKTINTFTTIATGAASSNYMGGVLAPNGKIYCIPSSATRVMEIDPLTNTTKLIGSNLGTGTSKWAGGYLGPDNFIYCMPFSETSILRIDWLNGITDNIYTITGTQKFHGGLLHSNGSGYGITHSSDTILKLDFKVSIKSEPLLCREVNKNI